MSYISISLQTVNNMVQICCYLVPDVFLISKSCYVLLIFPDGHPARLTSSCHFFWLCHFRSSTFNITQAFVNHNPNAMIGVLYLNRRKERERKVGNKVMFWKWSNISNIFVVCWMGVLLCKAWELGICEDQELQKTKLVNQSTKIVNLEQGYNSGGRPISAFISL